jgi:hypothetical protein
MYIVTGPMPGPGGGLTGGVAIFGDRRRTVVLQSLGVVDPLDGFHDQGVRDTELATRHRPEFRREMAEQINYTYRHIHRLPMFNVFP